MIISPLHKTMKQVKYCKQCSKEMTRPTDVSYKQWYTRQFCSRSCFSGYWEDLNPPIKHSYTYNSSLRSMVCIDCGNLPENHGRCWCAETIHDGSSLCRNCHTMAGAIGVEIVLREGTQVGGL